MSNPLSWRPAAQARRRLAELADAPPLQASIHLAADLPAPAVGGTGGGTPPPQAIARGEFQPRTLAVLVDTQQGLAGVCAAALEAGAPSVRVFRQASDILGLEPAPPPGLWGLPQTDAAALAEGGVVGGARPGAQAAQVSRALWAAEVGARAAVAAERVRRRPWPRLSLWPLGH
jgi:hypothetical protein